MVTTLDSHFHEWALDYLVSHTILGDGNYDRFPIGMGKIEESCEELKENTTSFWSFF